MPERLVPELSKLRPWVQLAAERNQAVTAALVVSLNLFRVTVDELAMEHRMAQATDFVLDLGQLFAAFRIYNVFETERYGSRVNPSPTT